MPSLICSSRYTIDSQILRKAARTLGWETLRLDGNQIPDWFDPPDTDFAFFYTAPHVFEIANQLDRAMVGCQPDWTVRLPSEFLRRELYQTTLADALEISRTRFVKHSVSKRFPAAVYEADSLAAATESVHPASLVHVGEPVAWTHEYRCFVACGQVMAVSPYVYDRVAVTDYKSFPAVSDSELRDIRDFATSVLQHDSVAIPAAFVLDVGLIEGRGWAVVECNECWAAGIYDCPPERVLETLLSATINASERESSRWDFARHYAAACPR